MTPVTGSFPNFIAAFIIGLFFVNAAVKIERGHSRLLVYVSSLLVFALLTIEEVSPIWGASTYYDVLDIIATGAGSLLAIVTYELIVLRRKKASMKAKTGS
jgi:glycopeptide antibiotics resistance protein